MQAGAQPLRARARQDKFIASAIPVNAVTHTTQRCAVVGHAGEAVRTQGAVRPTAAARHNILLTPLGTSSMGSPRGALYFFVVL